MRKTPVDTATIREASVSEIPAMAAHIGAAISVGVAASSMAVFRGIGVMNLKRMM